MSFILEALRKSERDRQAGEVPTLPAVTAEAPPPRRPWWPWLVAALLLFNVGGLTYLLLKGKEPAQKSRRPPPAQAARPPANAAPRVQPPAPVPPAPPAVSGPAHPAPSPGVPATPLPAPVAAVPSAPPMAVVPTSPVPQPSPAAARDAAPPAATGQSAPPALPSQPPSKSKPSAAAKASPPAVPAQPKAGPKSSRRIARPAAEPFPPEPLDAGLPPSAMARPAPFPRYGADEAAGRVRPRGGGPPLLGDMPPDFRAKVPAFRINVHAYSKVPAERFAIIDMKKYLAGDRIAGGPKLLEIRPESLVMDLDGTRFQVPRP